MSKFKITSKSGQPIKVDNSEIKEWISFGLIIFIGVFCLFGAKNLLAKVNYQQRVLSAAHKSDKQLATNIKNAASLSAQYNNLFENADPQNAIGGRSDTSANAAPPNVDNTRLALDALPVSYDYPALIASITKLLNNNGIQTPSINGTDQTGTVSSDPQVTPKPVQISLTINGAGNYNSVKNFFSDMEHSVRPFDVSSLQLNGTENDLKFTASLNTYFQPAKLTSTVSEEIR